MATDTTIEVRGMTCEHCERAVIAEVSALEGVEAVSVDLQSGAVHITSGSPIAPEAIAAAVVEAGYEVAT